MTEALENLLDNVLGIEANEEVVLLVDAGTDERVVETLSEGLVLRKAIPVVVQIPIPYVPGEECPASVAALLRNADVAIELTSLFIGSNRARQDATAAGLRYAAMPGVRISTFREGGPLTVDFDQIRPIAEAVGDAWTTANEFRITTPGGTDLKGSIVGRPGRVLHGICRERGSYMAPPDIEAGTAPLEGTTEGVAVIDADLLFMGTGPLPEPVILHFRQGELVDVEGSESGRLAEMLDRCNDDRMTNLAEVSLGLNPKGRICDVPMETEATLGSAHIALGNSIAYGGVVDAVAHLDAVMSDATLELDGTPFMVRGELV